MFPRAGSRSPWPLLANFLHISWKKIRNFDLQSSHWLQWSWGSVVELNMGVFCSSPLLITDFFCNRHWHKPFLPPQMCPYHAQYLAVGDQGDHHSGRTVTEHFLWCWNCCSGFSTKIAWNCKRENFTEQCQWLPWKSRHKGEDITGGCVNKQWHIKFALDIISNLLSI